VCQHLAMVKLSSPLDDDRDRELLKIALDHTWSWFALHATQRMQLINFFLISLAFVTAGYGTSLGSGRPKVASCVALAGALIALAFWRLDVRTRELIKAAEVPISIIQSRMAEAVEIPDLELVKIMERPSRLFTSYTSVLRALVALAVTLCTVGVVYGFLI